MMKLVVYPFVNVIDRFFYCRKHL